MNLDLKKVKRQEVHDPVCILQCYMTILNFRCHPVTLQGVQSLSEHLTRLPLRF